MTDDPREQEVIACIDGHLYYCLDCAKQRGVSTRRGLRHDPHCEPTHATICDGCGKAMPIFISEDWDDDSQDPPDLAGYTTEDGTWCLRHLPHGYNPRGYGVAQVTTRDLLEGKHQGEPEARCDKCGINLEADPVGIFYEGTKLECLACADEEGHVGDEMDPDTRYVLGGTTHQDRCAICGADLTFDDPVGEELTEEE